MRNNSPGESSEDFNFARCRYCNFPLDKSRDRTLQTAQITYTAQTGIVNADGDVPYDETHVNGCPFCACPQPYSKN